MTSIMRSLKTSLSLKQGQDFAKAQEEHSNGSPTSSCSSPIPQSPSFNDLSLGAHFDAEREYAAKPQAETPRSSFEGVGTPSSPRWLQRLASYRSASIPIPKSSKGPGLATQPSAPPREGKIDGLDFYEFVELIRSSSL